MNFAHKLGLLAIAIVLLIVVASSVSELSPQTQSVSDVCASGGPGCPSVVSNSADGIVVIATSQSSGSLSVSTSSSSSVSASSSVTSVSSTNSSNVASSIATSKTSSKVSSKSSAKSSSSSVSSSSSAAAQVLPSQVINLTNWKLQFPTGSNGNVTEIKQPQLATFQESPWFVVNTSHYAVRFRAPVNAPVTNGTSYPRTELREMSSGGITQASWSSTSGTHTFYFEEAITAVPVVKKNVVAGQILGSSTDVIQVKLESPKLLLKVGSLNGPTLDANYALGRKFNVKFVVSGGVTSVYYNGGLSPIYTLESAYTGYFKIGAYVISNCGTEGNTSLCNENDYGEVEVYKATVTHQ